MRLAAAGDLHYTAASRGALRRQFDPEWGGFGGAPKFPQPSVLEFLLRMHLHGDDDLVVGVGVALAPRRWPIFANSEWNRARRE